MIASIDPYIAFIAFGGWKSHSFIFTLGTILLGAWLWSRPKKRSELQDDRTENLRRRNSRSRSRSRSRTRNRNTVDAQNETRSRALSSNGVCSREHLESSRYYELFRYSSLFHRWKRIFLMIVVILSSLSIPWEFIRMYQDAVARRAAVMQQGKPPDCNPDEMGYFQYLKSAFLYFTSWNHDPCEKYYQKLLKDPLWDVPPIKVLTHCILYPFEAISSTIGQMLKNFFEVIPSQLQLPFIVLLGLVVVMVIVMACGYELQSPCGSFKPSKCLKTRGRRRRYYN